MSQLHERCRTAREIAGKYYRKCTLPDGARPDVVWEFEYPMNVVTAAIAGSVATLIVDLAGWPAPMIGILVEMRRKGVNFHMPWQLWDALVAIAEMEPAALDWIRRDTWHAN